MENIILVRESIAIYFGADFDFVDMYLPITHFSISFMDKIHAGNVAGVWHTAYGEIKAKMTNGEVLFESQILKHMENDKNKSRLPIDDVEISCIIPNELTQTQKIHALSSALYQGGEKWVPKAGDYYTSSRPDLELYQIVSIENGKVRTRYMKGSDAISEWDESGFLTEGFGPNRIHVPEWSLYFPE